MAIALILLLFYPHRKLRQVLDKFHCNETATRHKAIDWLAPAALMLICWLPFIALVWPGSLCQDYLYQLAQANGLTQLSSHHPILSTFIFGLLFRLGYFFNNANGGIGITVILQTIIMLVVFALMVGWLTRLGLPRAFKYAILAICCFWPIFPMYAQWCVKDTLSASFIALFCIQVFVRERYTRSTEHIPRVPLIARLPVMGLVGLLSALLRNNNIFIILPAILLLRPSETAFRRHHLLLVASILAFCVLWYGPLTNVLGAKGGSIREALCLPTQQIARYIHNHPNEITEEDRNLMRMLSSTPPEKIALLYDPEFTDPVKNVLTIDERSQLYAYIKLWARLGTRDFLTYIKAWLHMSYGYWYPAHLNRWDLSEIARCDDWSIEWGNDFFKLNYGSFLLDSGKSLYPVGRKGLNNIICEMAKIPVVGLIMQPGLFGIITILISLYQLFRKHGSWSLMVMGLLTVMICSASPVNGSMRYALPLVPILFLQIASVASPAKETD